MSRNFGSVATREKSVLVRRYFGMVSGGTDGVGISGAGAGADGVGASSGCVSLCVLKQANEQLRAQVSEVDLGKNGMRMTYYGSAQVGHLYFLGATAQTPHVVSDILREMTGLE